MNEKIDLDILKSIFRDHLEDEKQAELLREINKALIEEEQEKNKTEKPPKIPQKTVIILTSLPSGFDEKELENLAGFVTEIPEETPTRDIRSSIDDVRSEYNNSRKAKKNPAHSLGDLFELAPAKLFKENGVTKKPKGPAEFVFCPNR